MKASYLNLTIVFMVITLFPCCSYFKGNTLSEDKKVVSTKPESRYYHFTESQLEQKKGNLDKAIKHLNKAIEIDPESFVVIVQGHQAMGGRLR